MKRATIALIAAALVAGGLLAVLVPTASEAFEVKQTWGFYWYENSKTKDGPAFTFVVLEHRAWHTRVEDLGRMDRSYAGGRFSTKVCAAIQAELSAEDKEVYRCGGWFFLGFDTREEAEAAFQKRMEDFRRHERTFTRFPHRIIEVPTPTDFSRQPGVIRLGPTQGVATTRPAPSSPTPSIDAQEAARRAAEDAAQRVGTDAANADVLRADQATVGRNASASADYEARRRAHERAVAEAEAKRQKYERDMAAWRRRVAACNAGDYSQC